MNKRSQPELRLVSGHRCGLAPDELRYILDLGHDPGPPFTGETCRVLEEKETAKYGEYRTRRLVLEAWDRLPTP
jgi:hypothetical protein